MMTKKTIALMSMMLMFILGMSSCSSCLKKNSEDTPKDSTAVLVDSVKTTNLIVENLISTDREAMYLQYGKDYRWFETSIVLKNYLDEESDYDGVTEALVPVSGVSNIFQFVIEKEKSFDPTVVMFTHVADTTAVDVKRGAFWVGDCILNDAEIKLTFAQAYQKFMETNIVKPHSRQVVLRKELGPKDANPQYIFGNLQQHVYVDAVTGNVSTKNPVYEGFDNAAALGYAFSW